MTMHGPVSRRIRLSVLASVALGAWLYVGTASAGTWQPVGVGDCPGRDVAGSRGSVPEAGKCDASFAGYTAVCWATGCTYKNVTTSSCTGGPSPGQMYPCAGQATSRLLAIGERRRRRHDRQKPPGPRPRPRDPCRKGRASVRWLRSVRASWCLPPTGRKRCADAKLVEHAGHHRVDDSVDGGRARVE